MIQLLIHAALLAAASTPAGEFPEPGTRGRYTVLSCKSDTATSFETVEIALGPQEKIGDDVGTWFEFAVYSKEQDAAPAFEIRLLVARNPLPAAEDVPVLRYLLKTAEAAEALEYRNVHTQRAILPPWGHFQRYFLPHAAQGTVWQQGFPQTATILGQVLTLREVKRGIAWTPMPAKPLDLDPELMVGTARNFKDQEGRRLPQTPEKKDYTYVRFTAEDYQTMIAAGSNVFVIAPEQEPFVRDEPVFYLRSPSGKTPPRWPVDFYRSNYLGAHMFMDEPAIITVGDHRVNTKIQHFSDFAAVVSSRVRAEYAAHMFTLDKLLREKANLGDMRLQAADIPIWETLYETSFYQMAGGGSGIVHEGRYHLDNFTREVSKRAGIDRQYTADEMLRYYYATLRGAVRPFGKHWGTAIYGQCDPKIAPTAVTQGYDMGARYIWFWTSDHEHHLPWVEQMELTRTLRKHEKEHPRPSIFGPQPTRDLAIAIPYGTFLSLEKLWFIRELDSKGENEASAGYRQLLHRGFAALNEALDRHEDFDITVDDGREITGYKRVIRLADELTTSGEPHE